MPTLYISLIVIVISSVIWTQTSLRVDTAMKISHEQSLGDSQLEGVLQMSQHVRHAYDTYITHGSSCPANSTTKTVTGAQLCWPNNVGACIEMAAPVGFKVCVMADQNFNPFALKVLSGAAPGGLSPTAVRIGKPVCGPPGAPCLDCTRPDTNCFTVLFCLGTNASDTCNNGEKILQTFATRS